jgi:Abnormal spindle-like microcephaly-assoc'd, ASPM-SPD-2-Hydin
MLGCGGLQAGTPSGQSATGLVPTSANVDFGNVAVGTTSVKTNVIVNNSKSAVVIPSAQATQSSFTVTGQTFPLTLAPGQRVTLQISFSPQSGGSSQSQLVLGPSGSPLAVFTLRGTAIVGANLGGLIKLTPVSISFGNVPVGNTQSQTATLSNSGKTAVTVTRAAISGKGFAVTGLTLPLTLQGGQSANFNVTFTPVSGGPASGAIAVVGTTSMGPVKRPSPLGGRGTQIMTVALNTVSTNLSALVSGNGVGSGQLAISPTVLAMGSVKVGTTQTLSATLTNSGNSDLTIRQATITGKGFRMSGLIMPMTLAAGQSKSFAVIFTPLAAGSASGSIAVTTDASTISLPVSAQAITSGALISTPASVNFGTVPTGTPKTISETLTNSGSTSLTLTQASLSGAGFTLKGLALPLTLAPGQSTTFTVIFTPPSGGGASGGLTIASNATNATLNIPLAANVTTAGILSTSDSSLDFGNVPVNGTGTQAETLTNTGGTSVTITQAKVTGTAFSISGLSLPLTLAPGQSFIFGTAFKPASGGSVAGSIAVSSNASNTMLTITMAGTATVAGQLALSPATLNFGAVTVGQTKSMTASLTATGSSITVSNASLSTSEFTVSGISLPLTLAAGKTVSFTINFKPQSSGVATASGSFISNAANASVAQILSGTGAAAPQHSVSLSWNPDSSVAGYNVYRSGASGGPYAKITSMNPDTTYTDSSVQSGQTYFYVTTAVDGSGRESMNSNQIQAAIPTP